MTARIPRPKLILAVLLSVILVGGVITALRSTAINSRVHFTAYFANSNGIFPGDDVSVLGVPVGKIETIEPQPERAKITFFIDPQYKVPADAKAVILSPSLVTARTIQLTPAYTSGPVLAAGAVIPQDRTAVPVEFDDFRVQLQRLAQTLQPTQPGGVSTLGSFINTAADNLRGQGANVRDTLIKLSAAFSALGDHSQDLFSTVKNLSVLVSALQSSQQLLRELNQNLAAATNLLSNDPNEVANAVTSVNDVVGDVQRFVADNKQSLGTTTDELNNVTQNLVNSIGDVKQLLHVAPNAFQNFVNIYQPTQGSLTGALAFNNFSDPINFICGAVQAASRLGAEQSAKLCVQYLAPIIKNRQLNFPPLGENLFVGTQARPNEVTYSEDWMRPDYIPPQRPAAGAPPAPSGPLPPPANVFENFGEPAANPPADPPYVPTGPPPPDAQQTDPAAGLPGLMVPTGGTP